MQTQERTGRGTWSLRLLAVALLVGGLQARGWVAGVQAIDWVWGTRVQGLALSIAHGTAPPKVGGPIDVELAIRNFGTRDGHLVRDGRQADYRLAMYSEDGEPVALTAFGEVGANLDSTVPPAEGSVGFRTISPGEEYRFRLNAAEWFRVEQEGTYWLVVISKMESWRRPLLISNALMIRVAK